MHASFGELVGDEAVLELLAAAAPETEVEPGRTTSRRTVASDLESLLDDHASVRPLPLPAVVQPRHSNLFGVVALVLALGVAAALVWAAQIVRRNSETKRESESASAHESAGSEIDELAVIDANELTGPDDTPPALVEGPPVVAPRTTALSPSVVVRVRIDGEGKVAEAKIYRSRAELADFEQAALEAIEHYRFTPARKHGAVVSAWLNLPVSFTTGDPRGRRLLRIKGSDTIGGELGPALGRAFGERNRQVLVHVEAHGSSTGFAELIAGTAELAASSRSIDEAELASATGRNVELREYVIGYDGIAVIVHPDNPVRELDAETLTAVLSGEITNWSAFGGEGEIVVVSRPPSSGTHGFMLDKLVRANGRSDAQFAAGTRYVDSSRELIELVAGEARAIGYIGVGWVDDSVEPLAVAKPGETAVEPTADAISSGRYPIYRPLLLYARTKPDGEVAALLRFVLGSEGQAIVAEHGFVPVGAQSEDALPRIEDAGDGAAAVYVMQVHFGEGSTELASEGRLALRKLVAACDAQRVVVVGRDATDPKLAQARGWAVRDTLLAEGLTDARVELREAPLLGEAGARADIYVGL